MEKKVQLADLSKPWPKPGGLPIFQDFLEALPNAPAVQGLKGLASAIVLAKEARAPVVFAIGGHVIKTGCGPIISDLIEHGFVTHVAMNGAAMIHDLELALYGETSQDVDAVVDSGKFGNPQLAGTICGALAQSKSAVGLSIRAWLKRNCVRNRQSSILAHAYSSIGQPNTTIHLAIGADTLWNDLSSTGRLSLSQAAMNDYVLLRQLISTMSGKPAVWVNIGSAQFLPEVFLKASAWAIQNHADLSQLTKANIDFIRAYRPGENVLRRGPGKQSIELIGHHEIMLPLLRAAILCADKYPGKTEASPPVPVKKGKGPDLGKYAELYLGWR